MGVILSLLGLSYGIGNVVLQAAMLEASPRAIIGTTSGLFQTCRYLGSILSSIVLGIVFGKEISGWHMQILGMVLITISAISIVMSLRFAKSESDDKRSVLR
jgi:sugar phosphate permease